jgi:ATP-dependent DNA helicase RecG
MEIESSIIEYKSLKKILLPNGKYNHEGIKDLVTTCVCLANGKGGELKIGIDDKLRIPPEDQAINEELINYTLTQLRSNCHNVGITASEIIKHSNGGSYFVLKIFPSLKSIATTSDGKLYIRVGDKCEPIRGEDIVRLAQEKDSFQWELQLRNVFLADISPSNVEKFCNLIRQSQRVKDTIKNYSNVEILEHYNFVINHQLTNLGVLWLGNKIHRSRLNYPITVQYIVYDDQENKIRKIDWHDYELNPMDLLIDIEIQAIEVKYFDEFPNGLFRKKINHYDPRVFRELLINSFAHKSFTISGDILICVYPDRLEISNPGGLPLGINKDNILHSVTRRNPHLIKIFHDLELMEGEGTGYNLIYEITSRDSKPFPMPESDFNFTKVIQSSKILNEESIRLMDFVARNYQLMQKEYIVLGIVVRHSKVLATQLSKELQLSDDSRLRSYAQRLIELAILITRGLKKGTEYLVNPKLISAAKINIKPSLKLIELPRLKALIEETLKLTPNLTINELHEKIGDIDKADLRKTIYKMVNSGTLEHIGGKTYRKYTLAKKNRNEKEI